MSGLVLDLQQELLQENCDVLNVLRKAHLIAAKLKLSEFDAWIMSELNGYRGGKEDIPSYRSVRGTLKAQNPYRGWIPIAFSDGKIEQMLCEDRLPNSITEIIELHNNSTHGTFYLHFGADLVNFIMSHTTMPAPWPVALVVSTHHLKDVVEQVKNCILEWTLRLEQEGIIGEGMTFSEKETVSAQTVPQQINNYYGSVINGNVSGSQVVSGNDNVVTFNASAATAALDEIQKSFNSEPINTDDKESALELLDEINTKINQNKKPSVIKSALIGLKDFAINVGANVTAALIAAKIQGLF